jgi:sec-independent protein translocase protein TatB
MFEIGFSEVLVISAIALVVLGPEKLPKLAAQVGRWTGRARAMARQLRTQLEQEAHLQEVKRAAEQFKTAASSQPSTPPAAAKPAEDPVTQADFNSQNGFSERAANADQPPVEPSAGIHKTP